jgi:hypothetical protein
MLFAFFLTGRARLRQSAGFFAVLLLFYSGAARATVTKWTEPTAEELAMKAEPKAPGAPAVVLSYEETDDGDSWERTIHVRAKVLTAGGVTVGQIEVPRSLGNFSTDLLERLTGRTIHADGIVVPFVPSASSVVAQANGARAIALPQVEVGSIVEYIIHYEGRREQNLLYLYLTPDYAPVWRLQGPYFVRSAHYSLKLPDRLDDQSSRWVAHLPPGAELKRKENHVTLDLADVPAVPDESFMPPASAALYNVRFFYYRDGRDKYWGTTGNSVDEWWSEFCKPTKGLVAAVRDLTLATDDDEAKLRKLYMAVQKLENTDLTRAHLRTEDAKQKLREIQISEDVWKRKRGNSGELALLFIALARAAGFQAYPIAVASRGFENFDQNVLTWSQLDSIAAIVVVNRREVFFDPGTQMCPFGHMAPWHANVMGVSTETKTVKIRATPAEPAKAFRTERTADITLAADGSVGGTVTVVWTMNAGLKLRQRAISEDRTAVNMAAENELQGDVPLGTTVRLQSIVGLADGEVPLVATFAVSGRLGQMTRTRVVLPAQFFVSKEKAILVGETRTQPIEFPNAGVVKDQMVLHLPDGFSIESVPEERSADIFRDSLYSAIAHVSDGVVTTQRTFVLNRINYRVNEYADLRHYFSQIAGYDQDQIVLDTPKTVATIAGAP